MAAASSCVALSWRLLRSVLTVASTPGIASVAFFTDFGGPLDAPLGRLERPLGSGLLVDGLLVVRRDLLDLLVGRVEGGLGVGRGLVGRLLVRLGRLPGRVGIGEDLVGGDLRFVGRLLLGLGIGRFLLGRGDGVLQALVLGVLGQRFLGLVELVGRGLGDVSRIGGGLVGGVLVGLGGLRGLRRPWRRLRR